MLRHHRERVVSGRRRQVCCLFFDRRDHSQYQDKQDFRAIDLDLDDGSTNVAEAVLHRPAWQIEAGFESSPLMVTL
jgi:hypothetical protein